MNNFSRRAYRGAELSAGSRTLLALRSLRTLREVLLLFILLNSQCALAGLAITGITVDGKDISLNQSPGAGGGEMKPLRINESARSVSFSFANGNAADRPAARLRYKLEGYDKSWIDLPGKMRLFVLFADSGGQVVGSEDILLGGESPGWRGAAEVSNFVKRRDRVTVPARAATLKLAVISAPAESMIGIVGVDSVKLFVSQRTGGERLLHDFSVVHGAALSDPLGTPSEWMRQGSRAELAQLRVRPLPTPHTIMIIDDDDSARFGNWSTRPDIAVPVTPGDDVTIEWQAAYSIGNSGPGVANYKSLSPGSYLFRVQAARSNGESTGVEMSVPVTVVPLLYRRPEFWLAILASLIAAGAVSGRVVTGRRLQRRLEEVEREQVLERERARIARDLHDEVGAGLTAIAMQCDWVRREIAETAAAETQRRMDNICQSSVDLVRSVDEIVWAVNPANDTVDRVVNYLTQYTEQFLDTVGLRIRFDIQRELPDWMFAGAARHYLFQAMAEALNNIVKHAKADLVKLTVKVEDSSISIVIEDNGQGFEPDWISGDGVHDGLANMRRRMADIGGRFEISSSPGKGTRVEFGVPLGAGQVLRSS